MPTRIALLFVSLLALPHAAAADEPADVWVLDRFDESVQNNLGGYRNRYQRMPSTAASLRVRDVVRGRGGRSLRITADRQAEGFCGLWIHFFDMRSTAKQYLDSRPYAYLSFWVKGERGGEQFTVKLADRGWIEKEDAPVAGHIDQFLPAGVTTEWQEVLVPLQRLPRLNWRELGGLIFDFQTPGNYVLYIDDVSLKTGKTLAVPETPAEPLDPRAARRYPRALWVWSTQTLLQDRAACESLLEFCGRAAIDVLWIQLPYTLETTAASGESLPVEQTVCHIAQRTQLRWFLRRAHQRRLQVHALDGAPEFAQKISHHIPLSVVDAIVAFNQAVSADERFDGVHFDNEPYLLLGWHDWSCRQRILHEYLELNEQCVRTIRANSSMQFGVDIPFWWQYRDETTGRFHAEVTYAGKTQPASFHCLEMLDNVGIMNYRDAADGADGMIAHGRDLLVHGDKAGRAKVYMGIETFAYQPTKVWFVAGLPRALFQERLKGKAREFACRSRMNGFRLRTLDDGHSVHVGVELPTPGNPAKQSQVEHTLQELSRHFGASRHPQWRERAPHVREQALAFVAKDSQWTGYEARDIPASSTMPASLGFVADSLMLSKITFADDTPENLRTQVQAAEDFFRQYDSYSGIAIHFYETYRELLSQ